jgi:hypothetical protein
MNDPTTTYYLRLPTPLKRELRHRCVETGETLNTVIITAIRTYLDTKVEPFVREGEEVEP